MNRKNPITVDQAITVGQRLINVPIISCFIIALIFCIALSVLDIFPYWSILVGLLLSFGFSWLYWAFMIPKWKIWAFSNVQNVHELKKKAIDGQLIWPDGNVYEKSEIWSKKDRKKWEIIQEKFKGKDVFVDDFNIPSETTIRTYISNFGTGFSAIVIFFGGVYWAYKIDMYEILVFTTIVAYVFWVMSKEKPVRDPKIAINSQGIRIFDDRFYSWDEISNEKIIEKRSIGSTFHYLSFDHKNGEKSISIDNTDILPFQLTELLAVYRGRYENEGH